MRVAFVLLMLTAPSFGQDKPFTEAQIRNDCRYDAFRFCAPEIKSRDKQSVINCMRSNKEQLQAKCSRHIP